MPRRPWHCLEAEAAAQTLASALDRGLSAEEAQRRLDRDGANLLREAPARSPWRMLLDQFRDFMILMLLAAALISGVIGEAVDSLAIVAILVVNACIGFVQEYRAARAMQALKRLAAAHARVLRDGELAEIDAAGLVAGDVLLLEAGDLIPADVRLVELAAFQVDESVLTGESVPVEKHVEALADPALGVADRSNLAFKGTVATRGRARALVYATGMQTELGRIAGLMRRDEGARTPLQQRLGVLGTRLAYAALAICALVFVFGALRGESLLLMFMTAVSLAVAAVPEALPAVVTVALALGAAKMVRSQALIRRLPAVETLGSVSCICSDKTGTLTQNRMHVESLYVAGAGTAESVANVPTTETARWLLRAAALNNDARSSTPGPLGGDPTEIALLAAAEVAGYDKAELEQSYPRVDELPFDSSRKMMTTVHRLGAEHIALVKGAPEAVLARCSRLHGSERPFAAADTLRLAAGMAADGLRVMAFACRKLPPAHVAQASALEAGLEFLGLIGMLDPPRPEAEEAVQLCQRAGITVVMITGDHPATATQIARRLGIAAAGTGVVSGSELARMDEAEFIACARTARVYARVDPEQKIRIVKALQQHGECVAMTGDGVNDAPALRRADIGVAMGRAGTEVAREASDMVLLDDNFATIVRAVREGRRIYDNIRRFVLFVLAGNTGEILAISAAPFFGLPIPLLPIHLLWVNLVTDGLPGLALAAERADTDLMRQAPRPRDESMFARGLWQRILWVGLLIGALTLAVQSWAWHGGSPRWQTMAFCVLTFAQLGLALAVRSERRSLASLGLLTNPALFGAVALTVVLQLTVVYLPAANEIFRTVPLRPPEMLLCVAAGLTVLLAVELNKWRLRRS